MLRILAATLVALILAEARDLPRAPEGLHSTPTCAETCVVPPPEPTA
jgi:hypothetical protein